MKKILSIVLVVAFALSIPFIFNKSVTVEKPHKLDIDGNFILNEWVPSRVGGGDDWNYNLKPVKISDRVWCYFGAMEMPTKENAGDMSNSCYIKGDDQWITWDTGPSYIFAKQAYAEMKKIKDMPVKTVIISHEHDDHWLGNNYYKEVHGAKIIGAHSINENYFGPRHIEGKDYPGMQTRMIKALYQNATRDTVLALTDEAHDDTVEFEISGVKMEYVKVGYAHSEEDWFLYLPQVLYILIFLWLIIKGPGPYSADAVIAKKLGLDKDLDKEPLDEEKDDKDPAESGGASWTPPQLPQPA